MSGETNSRTKEQDRMVVFNPEQPPVTIELKPDRRGASLSPVLGAFLLANIAAMQPLLRPSAHKELRQFIATRRTTTDVLDFLHWTNRVVQAHKRDSRRAGPRMAARIVRRSAPKGMFRRPELAYRPRRIYSR